MTARRLLGPACWTFLFFTVLACPATCGFAQTKAAKPAHRFEAEIAAFEAADRRQAPPENAVLFTGSSTIRLWKTLAHDLPKYKVFNRGFGGCEMSDCTYFAQRIVIPYKPRLIVIRAGTNDIQAGKTPEKVRDDYRAFVEKVRAKLPDVRIAYLSINATPARWKNRQRETKANKLIREYTAQGTKLDYIDADDITLDAAGKPRTDLFVGDRLHFNSAGYAILAAKVNAYLAEQ